MQTSARAIAALEHEEGVVLRAYLCPAGKWTIYTGLTSAAGVGTIKAGMVITRDQGRAMLFAALAQNYEPRVTKAMPAGSQHAFDAAVLFDFNTGAIHRATWVGLWRKRATRADIWAMFKLWNKGGGKVLPGLVKRREREFAILMDGVYPVATPAVERPIPTMNAPAVWALSLSPREAAEVRVQLGRLGYLPSEPPLDIPASSVRNFQRDHALTVDGIIGRATLSTLQRRIDAVAKAKPAAAATAGAGAVTAAPAVTPDAVPVDLDPILSIAPQVGPIILAGAALWTLFLCWRYRDVIAAKVQHVTPRLARLLRSF
jgi:lysozyme